MLSDSVEVLKKIYKPYRYTYKGNAIIINTTSGDFVLKEKNDKNIKDLYNYLNSRNFNSFPNLIDDSRIDINVYQYIESVNMPKEQKALDLINSIASLHNKTTFYKNVTQDDFKSIYDNLESNIIYLKNYYNNLYENIKKHIYMSPKEYLLMRNIHKIFSCLDFCETETKNWFALVENETKKRVSIIHNNLKLDHFIKNQDNYLISWDLYRTDSPIMDLIKFYKNEYFNINFSIILEEYFTKVKITEDEKKLFFIYIAIPDIITLDGDEFTCCRKIRKGLDYLFITENLIRPYYTPQEKN